MEGDDEDENYFTHLAKKNADFPDHSVPYTRLRFMAYSLQLVIKLVYKSSLYQNFIIKTRYLVGEIKKLSVSIEKLIAKYGKLVVADCVTRWNSTFYIIN